MTTKEMMLRAVEDLPPDATIEDAMERFFLSRWEFSRQMKVRQSRMTCQRENGQVAEVKRAPEAATI